MYRFLIAGMAAIVLTLASASQDLAQHTCKPTMAFTEAHYSPMKLPKLERKWTVAFTVDASSCATETGSFSIQFTMWKENAPDTEFVETFSWKPDLNVISKEFWVDEAVGAYRVSEVPSCPCRK
jgi:hypothetical protein